MKIVSPTRVSAWNCDALYDTTMPYRLTQRLSMPLANLVTEVVQR